MILHFFIRPIVVGLVISGVSYFQGKVLYVLVPRIPKCVVIEVAVTSTEENYLIVERTGVAYGGELGHEFNPPIYIRIHLWCVVYYPVL